MKVYVFESSLGRKLASAAMLAVACVSGFNVSATENRREHYPLLTEAEAVNEQVKFSESFGAFNDVNFPWVYHFSLGWTFLGHGSEEGFWMFNTSMNKWLWSSSEKFPYAYNLNDQN